MNVSSKGLSMPLWDQCVSLIYYFIFSRPLSCGLISRVVDEYGSNFKSFFFFLFFSLKSELFEWIDCKFPMLSRVQLTIKKMICMNEQFSDNGWNFRCICFLFCYSSWKKLIERSWLKDGKDGTRLWSELSSPCLLRSKSSVVEIYFITPHPHICEQGFCLFSFVCFHLSVN